MKRAQDRAILSILHEQQIVNLIRLSTDRLNFGRDSPEADRLVIVQWMFAEAETNKR